MSGSGSKSKSKSFNASLASCYELLSANRKKKGKYFGSSQPASAIAGVKEKIDAASGRQRDLERGDSEERPIPQQSSDSLATKDEDPSGATSPTEIRRSHSPDSALGASYPTEVTVDTTAEMENSNARPHERDGARPHERDGARPHERDGARPHERDGARPPEKDSANLGEKEKTELAEALIDPKHLWEDFFSGIIDDFADAVEENVEENKAKLSHPKEVQHAQRRGEHRFAGVCHFPLKLIFTPLKQGRRVANTFASLLEMQFGPLHAALQVGNVILEWDDSSLVRPYLCAYEDQILQVDVQPYSEWAKYTGKHHSKIKKAVEGLDYHEQIELIYTVSSEKKKLIDALIQVIIQYNKHYYYNLFDRNCQHFVCDALKALEVKLPANFEGGLGDYYKALVKGRAPSIPEEFETHLLLDDFVKQKLQDGSIAYMRPHDLEFILGLYFRFHLEVKVKNEGSEVEWQCPMRGCYMAEIEKRIELRSMMIHNFRTIA